MSECRVAGMKVKPLGDRVYIVARKGEEKTSGGIYIPEDSIEKATIGTIKAIGKDVVDVKVGDLVIWDSQQGQLLYHDDGSDGVLVKEKYLLAEFEE